MLAKPVLAVLAFVFKSGLPVTTPAAGVKNAGLVPM
jgi:hypothetical protein